MIMAGSHCPPDVSRYILRALPTADLWNLYGMTECGFITSQRLTLRMSDTELSAAGDLRPGVRVLRVDPATGSLTAEPVRADGTELGEVVFGRASMSAGYWDRSAEMARLFTTVPSSGARDPNDELQLLLHQPVRVQASGLADRWIRTGDLAVVLPSGKFALRDRLKDIIVGESTMNVYPSEVEAVLREHPAVADCAVYGYRPRSLLHESIGELVHAAVVMSPTAVANGMIGYLLVDELKRDCQARLAAFRCPEVIHIVAAIPRNASGKVDRQQLRALSLEAIAQRSVRRMLV
jgi:fatty-acyl-CoA synthase